MFLCDLHCFCVLISWPSQTLQRQQILVLLFVLKKLKVRSPCVATVKSSLSLPLTSQRWRNLILEVLWIITTSTCKTVECQEPPVREQIFALPVGLSASLCCKLRICLQSCASIFGEKKHVHTVQNSETDSRSSAYCPLNSHRFCLLACRSRAMEMEKKPHS